MILLGGAVSILLDAWQYFRAKSAPASEGTKAYYGEGIDAYYGDNISGLGDSAQDGFDFDARVSSYYGSTKLP